jgi:glycosyltransferase involved in cell wall biosynthesis
MNPTAIGLFIADELDLVGATVQSIKRHTNGKYRLILMAASTPPRASTALCECREFTTISLLGKPRAPQAFNQFVASTNEEVVVWLESGALVGPGWLDHLLSAFAANSRNGLAGPSTNRAWNEQCAFPNTPGNLGAVAHAASEARQRFGTSWRALEPLHSLADFCYAVRRQVIEDVGLADEGYGQGPCWEMDYNIRAARAGWRGVWVPAAYVWRAPPSPQRQSEEARLFQASKQHYQDKFCGARLRGIKSDYRTHCRGDACPNFAPVEFRARWTTATSQPGERDQISKLVRATERLEIPVAGEAKPLVTCIMPTCDRRAFVPAAIRNFLAQDYPNLELLILDDGADAIADLVPPDARIRYLRLPVKKILGEKRNLACEQARGDFIAHWDDDDWYPANRISRQISALIAEEADLCGTSQMYYHEPSSRRGWLYSYSSGARAWVAGSTLAYRRSFWRLHPFPPLQVGEDTRFVWADTKARLCDLRDPALCVATVHPGNTSRKLTNGTCWRPWPVGEIQRLLVGAFEPLPTPNGASPAAGVTIAPGPPLISCIMPTANRRKFVALALRVFEAQNYPNKELIIVDDGQEDLTSLAGNRPGIRYVRLTTRQTIGAKRNLACQHARGEIIAHWDDDDWYAPNRLSYQAEPLLSGKADLTGLETGSLLELSEGRFWTISPSLHRRMFIGDVHGGTLVFRKSLWDQGIRYPEVNLAEDAALIRAAMNRGARLARLPNAGCFVYVRHGKNAWTFAAGRFLDGSGWQRAESPLNFQPFLSEYQHCLNNL